MKTYSITSLNFDHFISSDITNEVNRLKFLKYSNIKVGLDKLELHTNSLKMKSISKNFKKISFIISKNYKSIDKYVHKNTNNEVQILMNNRNTQRSFKHKIEINPKNFKTLSELEEFLSLITNLKKEHKITRIDISFTFPKQLVSVRSFFLSTYIHDKQYSNGLNTTNSEYMSFDIETFSFGKKPHRLTIYDRSLKRKYPEDNINFEIQISGKKVFSLLGITLFKDIRRIYKSNPLDRIFFLDISEFHLKRERVDTFNNMTNLYYNISTMGLNLARNMYNKDKKFDRDIIAESKLINLRTSNKKNLKELMIKSFQESMRTFIFQ